MSPSSKSAKEELRRALREDASRHDHADRERESARICARIKEQPIWPSSKSVLFFWPMPGEPDLRPLVAEALKSGKTVAFPKYLPESSCYAAVRITAVETDMVSGQFGIAEPASGSPDLQLKVLDLIFVPGIGFSFDGARLGHGKGHYDRLLSRVTGTRCGVAFDWQMIRELPSEAHDVRLDCVVTPSLWRQLSNRPAI